MKKYIFLFSLLVLVLPFVSFGAADYALYTSGVATTTNYTLPTAANQLATSTAYTNSGIEYMATGNASTTLSFVTRGVDYFDVFVCGHATSGIPVMQYEVQYSNDVDANAMSSKVWFNEVSPTGTAVTGANTIVRTMTMATSTADVGCAYSRVNSVNAVFAQVKMKITTANAWVWKAIYGHKESE